MGMYSTNNWNLTVPIAEFPAIIAEADAKNWQTGEPIPATPDAVVDFITQEWGAEDVVEYDQTEDTVVINGYSYGKIGQTDVLGPILAAHGATGIVHGDCDGYLFLDEFKDGVVESHSGVIVYPSYKGDLYQP